MRSVVDAIEEVRAAAGPAWKHEQSVAEWAAHYGHDLRSAWLQCRRGDFLATLAPLVRLDARTLHVAVHHAMLGLVALVPGREEIFEELVAHVGAMGAPLPSNGLERQQAFSAAARAEEEAARLGESAARPAMMLALATALDIAVNGPSDEQPAQVRRSLGTSFEHRELVLLRSFHEGRHRRAAAAHAVRALISALAFSKNVESESMLSRGTQAVRERHAARLAACAGDVLRQASRARAWLEGCREETWSAGLDALADACLRERRTNTRTDNLPRVEELWTCFASAIAERMVAREEAVRKEYADDLRTLAADQPLRLSLAPADPLELRPSRLDDDGATNRREALRNELRAIAHLSSRLQDAPLAEAMETAMTILGANGPLAHDALVRVMATVHERLLAVIRLRARTLLDPDRREWDTIAAALERTFDITSAQLEREAKTRIVN